jgi:hypothetical protein
MSCSVGASLRPRRLGCGLTHRFGSELEAATEAIAGPVTHAYVDNGDHGLRRRDEEVAAVVAAWVLGL